MLPEFEFLILVAGFKTGQGGLIRQIVYHEPRNFEDYAPFGTQNVALAAPKTQMLTL